MYLGTWTLREFCPGSKLGASINWVSNFGVLIWHDIRGDPIVSVHVSAPDFWKLPSGDRRAFSFERSQLGVDLLRGPPCHLKQGNGNVQVQIRAHTHT